MHDDWFDLEKCALRSKWIVGVSQIATRLR